MAQLKSLGELGDTYRFLALMAEPEKAKTLEKEATHKENRMHNLEENHRSRARKHCNPDKLVSVRHIDDIESLMQDVGPIWVLLDRKKG